MSENFVEVKSVELIDAALDWAAAKCEGKEVEIHSAEMIIKRRLQSLTQEEADTLPPPKPYLVIPGVSNANYSGDWAQGGPIINRMMRDGLRLSGYTCKPTDRTSCQAQIASIVTGGETPLIAAMRCYVASKLGDTVMVPKELLTA